MSRRRDQRYKLHWRTEMDRPACKSGGDVDYAEDPEEVTCKRCLGSPEFKGEPFFRWRSAQ